MPLGPDPELARAALVQLDVLRATVAAAEDDVLACLVVTGEPRPQRVLDDWLDQVADTLRALGERAADVSPPLARAASASAAAGAPTASTASTASGAPTASTTSGAPAGFGEPATSGEPTAFGAPAASTASDGSADAARAAGASFGERTGR